MADTRNLVQDLQDQFLETVRNGQDAFVDLVKSFSAKQPYGDAVKSYVVKPYEEAVSSWTEAVRKFSPQGSPLATAPEGLPSLAEVIDDAYDFAGRLLATQREFAHKVIDAASVTSPKE